ncbi:uncharacterized protein LTR77_007114 [Saxophila tyrrhenica]|uniref:Metallo-beta-lactamase domain-containing protein n=1 Tax=Saxophila tyrrhenica TaxID=1690608 RepID=A0AAV9P4H5_9PEZI|nr:hypothetical protein LTR77_007114 [Saxophila tyrrhenica]
MSPAITVDTLPSRQPDLKAAKDHHVGSPPTSFKNPWPSYHGIAMGDAFKARFGNHPEKNFVPVPQGPDGSRSDQLVKVRQPDWGLEKKDRLRSTWIGHASFLVETPASNNADRGVRILFDPVFSERTSPVGFLGPKRYSPTPCAVSDLPEVDIVCISHNHYDHLDYYTIIELYRTRKEKIHFFVPLNDKAWFVKHICPAQQVTELDWWQSCKVQIEDIGAVTMTCTPSQHGSSRTGWDKDRSLWCSWTVEMQNHKLFFAGDTAYQAVDTPSPCPAFEQVGETFGGFDLAMLPIGLFKPQSFMGGVHASPEQSLQIHKEINSKLSIGMHYGTVRGGISGQFEDVTEPPRRWREAAEKEGLWSGGGIEGRGQAVDVGKAGVGLCDIGETVAI